MIFPDKKILLINGILLAIILVHSVYRDIQLEKQYPGDLRNRIVGARLQKDGKLPYHYHWQRSDGIRYYNQDEDQWVYAGGIRSEKIPQASDVNKITASPFFHELLYPICDLPQRTVSIIWFWGQYFMMICMIVMIAGLTKDKGVKWLLLNIAILFTTTEAWKNQIAAGQIYLFEAFLISCILTVMVKNKKYGMISAGILSVIFILTRPIGMILFIPFLFYFKKYFVFILTAFTGLLLYTIFIFISPKETALYNDYVNGMKMQVQLHQAATNGLPPQHLLEESKFSNIEGFDIAETQRLSVSYPVKVYIENGNVFVIYFRIFHKKLPLPILMAGLACTISVLLILFFIHVRNNHTQTLQFVIFSFSLYMIVELFNPVYRHQYNAVQWFPLVLAAFLLLRDWKLVAFFLLVLGLVLNICNFSWLPMRHTIGECCWLTALLQIAFSSRTKQVV